MATLAELQDALRNANKAGATDDARMLADAIVALQSPGQAKPAERKPYSDVEDPGFMNTVAIGAGKMTDSVLDGFTQMYLGARGEKSASAALKQGVDEKRAIYAPLAEKRPWATGIGEAIPSMVIPVGGSASLLMNAGKMGLAGAIPGALEYGTLKERGGRAVIGGAAGASFPLLGAVAKTVKAFMEPLTKGGRDKIAGRVLNRVAGDSAPDVISRLKNAAPLVPGSMPTAAEVAESGGIAAMQRAAAQANPEAYTTRAMEQASARIGALRGIAGDDATMAAAKAARASQSGPLFQQATKAVYQVDDKLANLLDRPDMKDALKRAARLAENDGRKFQFSTTSAAPFKGVGGAQPEIKRQITGQGLQDLKMAIDEMLTDPAGGFAGSSGRSLKSQRGQILDWMEGANPVFKQARTTHANMSKPINQMEVGQYLLDKAQPALADFGALGKESGATYARALRNAEQTVRGATKFKGVSSLEDVMSPDQMSTLTGIAKDLARKSNAQDLGRGVGSDTFQKLAMSNIAQQSGVPRLMGGLMETPGISRATRWIYSDADQAMQGLLADAFLNPKMSAGLMERASKQALLPNSPKARKALEELAMRGGLLAAPAGYGLAER